PPQHTVGTRERLGDLEVVVAFADEQLHRFAGCLDRRSEFARLALELWCLECAVGDDDGGVELVEMTLRAQRLLDLVGELDIRAARRETNRLQVEETTAAQPAFDRVHREIEVLAPVGDEDHAREMTARGMPRHVESVRVPSKALRVAKYPGHRAAH